MSDLIKREDAERYFGEFLLLNRFADFKKANIEKLVGKLCERIPSAEPKQEWIPCSERLPEEEFGTYLICTENGYMCSCRWTNDMYGLGQTEWSKWGWHIMDKPQYSVVGAWMPIEPWEGADE